MAFVSMNTSRLADILRYSVVLYLVHLVAVLPSVRYCTVGRLIPISLSSGPSCYLEHCFSRYPAFYWRCGHFLSRHFISWNNIKFLNYVFDLILRFLIYAMLVGDIAHFSRLIFAPVLIVLVLSSIHMFFIHSTLRGANSSSEGPKCWCCLVCPTTFPHFHVFFVGPPCAVQRSNVQSNYPECCEVLRHVNGPCRCLPSSRVFASSPSKLVPYVGFTNDSQADASSPV